MNPPVVTPRTASAVDEPPAGRGDWWRFAAVAGFWSYAVLLTVATHVPNVDPAYLATVGKLSPMQPDKAAHLVAYGLLGALAGLAFARGRSLAAFIRLALVLACWGVVDEVTQPFFRRSADFWDWCYDVVGLMIGLSCVAALCRQRGAAGRDAVSGPEAARPS